VWLVHALMKVCFTRMWHILFHAWSQNPVKKQTFGYFIQIITHWVMDSDWYLNQFSNEAESSRSSFADPRKRNASTKRAELQLHKSLLLKQFIILRKLPRKDQHSRNICKRLSLMSRLHSWLTISFLISKHSTNTTANVFRLLYSWLLLVTKTMMEWIHSEQNDNIYSWDVNSWWYRALPATCQQSSLIKLNGK